MPSPRGSKSSNGFDKLAAPYRWLEYLSFGPFLSRTRCAFLQHMHGARHALILGDGDGRFTAALLQSNPWVHVHAVDASSAMLQRLSGRVASQGDAARLTTHHADARSHLPEGHFDLVCTHFFLDCLTDSECADLARRVAARLPPGADWVVSDFAVPAGHLRLTARLLIRALYATFGVLTGLRVRSLPDHGAALVAAGLHRRAQSTHLGGILRSELWLSPSSGAPEPGPEHPMDHE